MYKSWKKSAWPQLSCLLATLLAFCVGSPTCSAQLPASAPSQQSAGQVASVFEQQPQWIEWIASKNSKSKPNSTFGEWGSWWSGPNKSKSRLPVSSYRRDNKTYSQRMWASTKRAWNTTAAWLDPYPAPKPDSTPPKKSWFSSWSDGWGGKSSKPSQSVSEFIGQEYPN